VSWCNGLGTLRRSGAVSHPHVIPSERRFRASEASRGIVIRWRRGICTWCFTRRRGQQPEHAGNRLSGSNSTHTLTRRIHPQSQIVWGCGAEISPPRSVSAFSGTCPRLRVKQHASVPSWPGSRRGASEMSLTQPLILSSFSRGPVSVIGRLPRHDARLSRPKSLSALGLRSLRRMAQ